MFEAKGFYIFKAAGLAVDLERSGHAEKARAISDRETSRTSDLFKSITYQNTLDTIEWTLSHQAEGRDGHRPVGKA